MPVVKREVRRMAKGSHRRPDKRKKKSVRESDELKDMQRIKNREKASRKTKVLTMQLRGKKWDADEYSEELENELEEF